MSTSKQAELAHCPACRRKTTRDPDGSCVPCRLEAQRVERRAELERQRAADRKRLGLQPSRRGPALVALSIDAAVHWSEVSRRAGAPLPDTVARHLEAARRELNGKGQR